MKYKLAIFDMDGTILNTLDDLADSCNEILKQYGFPVHTNDEIRFFVGNGIPKLIERAVPEGVQNPQYQNVLNSFIEYYKNHSAEKTRPYDGMTEFLQKLKDNGVLLAVNTNKVESAAIDLCEKYFPGVFHFVAGGKPGHTHKPSPDGVNEIMAKVPGIKKEQVVFIGDSDVDIQTGINAGVDAIGVAWGFRGKEFLQEHGAKKIAMDCDELFKML